MPYIPLNLRPKHENDTYHHIHQIIKIYPNRAILIDYERPIKAKLAGYVAQTPPPPRVREEKPDTQSLSLLRTKKTLRDLVECNQFDLFATFTFAYDRDDIDKTKHKMFVWLKNQKRLHGKFDYILVPEFHKDGRSIHFHALIKGYKGKLTRATNAKTGLPLSKKGREVYNIGSYKLGFTEAVKIDPGTSHIVGNYVRKYITKSMPLFTSKKRYWSSQGLKKPLKIINPELSPASAQFVEKYRNENIVIYETHATITKLTVNRGNLDKLCRKLRLTATKQLQMSIRSSNELMLLRVIPNPGSDLSLYESNSSTEPRSTGTRSTEKQLALC